MKNINKQSKITKQATKLAKSHSKGIKVGMNHVDNIKKTAELNVLSVLNPIPAGSPVDLKLSKEGAISKHSIKVLDSYTENLLKHYTFGIDTVINTDKMVGMEPICTTNYNSLPYPQSMTYLSNSVDNLLMVSKAGMPNHDVSLLNEHFFNPTSLSGQLGYVHNLMLAGSVITIDGIKSATKTTELNLMAQSKFSTQFADLQQCSQKFSALTNGMVDLVLNKTPEFNNNCELGQLSTAFCGIQELLNGYNTSSASLSLAIEKNENTYFSKNLSNYTLGNLDQSSYHGINTLSSDVFSSLEMTASIVDKATDNMFTGRFPSATDLTVGKSYASLHLANDLLQPKNSPVFYGNSERWQNISKNNLYATNLQNLSNHGNMPSLMTVNDSMSTNLQPVLDSIYRSESITKFTTALTHGVTSDFTVVSGALNSMAHLAENLRWYPDEVGGLWKDELVVKPVKQEDEQIAQLKCEVFALKNEVKYLRSSIEQIKSGQSLLLNSKLGAVEQRTQLVLTASTNQNSTAVFENDSEELIDRYGVMKMLDISESTYHRHKKSWSPYQIGAKKLYKASEIRAQIKCFRK